jgi:hypothetical protein
MVRAAAVEVSHSARCDCWIKGRSKMAESSSTVGEATMPDGAAIFETSGAWADFSTLSRISVSLIVIDLKIFQIGSRGGRTARRYRGTRASRTSIAKCARIGACITENLASPRRRPLRGPLRSSMSSIAPPIFETSTQIAGRDFGGAPPAVTDEGSTCNRHASSAQHVNDSVPRVVPRTERKVEMWRGGGGPNSWREDD